jgi:hypothetical protein
MNQVAAPEFPFVVHPEKSLLIYISTRTFTLSRDAEGENKEDISTSKQGVQAKGTSAN